jgi:broad specificity phosphatase PhoE
VETEALRQLMEADRWIDRVGAQRAHLPEQAQLEGLEAQLRILSRELAQAKEALAPVRASYEATTAEAKRLAKRCGDLETILASSTANARELAALHKELEHVRQLLSAAEDRELELLIEVEPLDEAVAAVKARAQPDVARRSELQAAILELQASARRRAGLASRRARGAGRRAVARPARPLRGGLSARVGTSGAAQVVAGRCDGCRIAALAPRPRSVEGPARGDLHELSRVRAVVAAVIILIRHGQTTTNAARLLVGQSDPDLTELGRASGDRAAPVPRGRARGVDVTATARSAHRPVGPSFDRSVREASPSSRWTTARSTDSRSAGDEEQWRAFETTTTRPSATASRWRRSTNASTRELSSCWRSPQPDARPERHLAIVSHMSPIKSAVTWALGVSGSVAWRMNLEQRIDDHDRLAAACPPWSATTTSCRSLE